MTFSPTPRTGHFRAHNSKLALLQTWSAVLSVLLTYVYGVDNVSEPSCPGVYGQVCTLDCQVAICRALASFYRATNNPSQPWQHDSGWRWTNASSCESLLTSGPVYCEWEGVQCCTAEMVEAHRCSAVYSVKALDLQVNGLNGSIASPAFMSSLLQLHACGAVKLQLQGNDLSGSLNSSGWGQLVNLTYLDLANNWLHGTIPETLRHLTRLTRLSLGTNQFSGTLPASLGELTALETLNLGANTGNDDPDAEPTTGSGVPQGLTGTIPASLANLANLTVLNLELNSLVGALPEQLCRPAGASSRLRMLKLRGNRLGGNFEELLHCTLLAQLDVSSNDFSGPFRVTTWDGHLAWPNLAVLDASSNQFNGSIPVAIYELPVLEYLNLANNKFSGQIRRHITLTTYLKELNLEHNQLTGPIDPTLWLLPHLRLLDLSHNKLTGTIDMSIGQTFNLEELQLSNNNLSGPLPPQLGFLKKIDLINLLKNDNLRCLAQPSVTSSNVDGPNNPASSGVGVVGSAGPQCSKDQLLPCFLQFSNYTLPRTDASNMSCPLVLRRRYADAQKACAGDGPIQLGKQAHNMADGMADEQVWKLEPGYYQYRGCLCLPGYQEVWARSHTVLVCIPVPPAASDDGWVTGLVKACSIAGALFLTAVALLVWLRMAVQLRPRWQREKELAANRKKGMPSNASASIVVTDIEKYSELMQNNAPLATKVLGIHNSILRRAAAAHAGNVVEQEGDSWSVAFHTPTDVVAFCLQVQQALHRVNWPRDLASSRSQISWVPRSRSGASDTAAAAATAGQADAGNFAVAVAARSPAAAALVGLEGELNGWQQPQQQQKESHGSPAPAHWVRIPDRLSHQPPAAAATHAAAGGTNDWGIPCETKCSFSSNSSKPHQLPVVHATAALCDNGSSRPHSFCVSDSNPSTMSNSFICKDSALDLGSTAVPLPAAAAADGTLHGSSGKLRQMISFRLQRSRSSRFWSIIGFNPAAAAASSNGRGGGSGSSMIQSVQGNSMRGLRVRMGVASGFVPADTDIARCALFELAKGVSDLARGGQILLDSVTFSGIRDRLTELGSVDHRGYIDVTLAAATRAAMKQHTSGLLSELFRLLRVCLSRDDQQCHDSDALLLDMGEYYLPRLAAAIPAAAAACTPNRIPDLASLSTMVAANRAAPHSAALAAAAAALSSSSVISNQLLQLYSILPRCLADRAYEFGGVLNLKEGDEQTGLTYFDAPGTDAAQLRTPSNTVQPFSNTSTPNSTAAAAAGSSHAFSRMPLPYVTVMFVAVEPPHGGGCRHDDVARILHNTISRIMQVLLMSFADVSGSQPPGTCYLCREQCGDLRYMLAFREPAQAAEWALALQEIMLYVPWPKTVLDTYSTETPTSPTAAARSTSSSGVVNSIGRPALNISFAEGLPSSIGPDHLGRADYHGPSVNAAARMLAAAAAGGGGRIVTSMELAQSIFSTWCYQAAIQKAHDTKEAIAGLAGVNRPASTQMQAWQQQQQHENECAGLGISPDMASRNSSGVLSAVRQPASCEPLGAPGAEPPCCTSFPTRLLNVSAWQVGTYQFKGCGTADMVALTADMDRSQYLGQLDLNHQSCDHALMRSQLDLLSGSPTDPTQTMASSEATIIVGHHQQDRDLLVQQSQDPQETVSQVMPERLLSPMPASGLPPKGSKCQLLLLWQGPVVGLQKCLVVVPDVLPSLIRGWRAAAAAAAAAAGNSGAGRSGEACSS